MTRPPTSFRVGRLSTGVFLASFSTLLLQLAFTRILSVSFHYHFSFLVVSLAMLGLGSSGVAVGLRPPGPEPARVDRRLANAALLFAPGAVRVFRLYKRTGGQDCCHCNTITPAERLSSLTARVQNTITNTMVVPDLKGIALLNTALFHLFVEEIFLMNIRNNLKSATNRFVKRLFDITVSIISRPVLLPFIGIIGLIIRMETPGFAIYAHDRIGKNGKSFRCYKFRTMRKDAEETLKEVLENSEILRNEWEQTWKLKEDPRITKIGRFLRRSSLDELPQIFNVLRGEMSLVGPRPYLPREKTDIIENIQVICSAKPGLPDYGRYPEDKEADIVSGAAGK